MRLVPDKVFSSIHAITPEMLAREGILGVAADLDNTLAGYSEQEPSAEVSAWLAGLTDAGLRVAILTNNGRARAERFCQGLNLPFVSNAGKPGRRCYREVTRLFGLAPEQIAAVGDQVFTDVWGAHRAGLRAFLVTPLNLHTHWFFRLRYALERPFIKRALKRAKEKSS